MSSAKAPPIDVAQISPRRLVALIGCTAPLFFWFHAKFCAGFSVNAVFMALWFLKTYPTEKGATLFVNGRVHTFRSSSVWRTILIVSARCATWFFNPNGDPLRQLQVHTNFVPALGRAVVGLVDVVPVYVGRMKGCSSVQFQPKYKRCVAKFQFVTNLQGVPVWWSGPHLGVMNDLEIFRMYPPPLRDGEMLLADKGYQNNDGLPLLFSTRKNSRVRRANPTAEEAKDEVIGWYRSTVEHYFAQMKSFRIVFGQLRCRSVLDKPTEEKLKAAMHIITAIKYKQIHDAPLKDLQADNDYFAAAAAAAAAAGAGAGAAAAAAAAGAGAGADEVVRLADLMRRAGMERRRLAPVMSDSDHERFDGDDVADADLLLSASSSSSESDDDSESEPELDHSYVYEHLSAGAAAPAAAAPTPKSKPRAKGKGKAKGKRNPKAGAKRKRDDEDPAVFLEDHMYEAMQASLVTAEAEAAARPAAAAAAAAAADAAAAAAAATAAADAAAAAGEWDPEAPAPASESAAVGAARSSARLRAAAKRRKMFGL